MEWVVKTLNHLLLIISNWVYTFIGWLYQVFIAVAKVNLFDRATFKGITSRLYIIVAIAMLFIFAYQIILMIINPDDKKGTGQATKIVKETIISLVLIILLPTIFNYLYVFQNNILDSNIIGKIILGTDESGSTDVSNCDPLDYDCTCNFNDFSTNLTYNFEGPGFWDGVLGVVTLGIRPFINNIQEASRRNDIKEVLRLSCEVHRDELSAGERGANSVSPILLSAFYRPTKFTFDDCVSYLRGNEVSNITDDIDKKICVNYFVDYNMARYTGNIDMFVDDAYLREITADSSKDNMEFNGLWALLAGGLAAWMFLCYAMEIGVRVAKLGVLQLISPIPVMMRIIPKQKEAMYDKWFKHLVNTYTDVFIRLIIIFFSLFAISLVPNVMKTMFSSMGASSDNFLIRTLASVFVILGILKFAQDAPNLIKEFFGDSGRFALRSPKKQFNDNKYATKGLGMVTGSVGSGVVGAFRNFKKTNGGVGAKTLSALGGLTGGLFRGGYAGYKNGVGKSSQTISTTVDNLEVSRDKHKALRDEGILNVAKSNIIKKKDNFVDFLFGNVASTELGNAAKSIMVDVDNMENDFSNANIAGIKSGRDEIMKKFNSDQDFDFNGKRYHKVDGNNWTDGAGNTIQHGDLGKSIVDSFKSRLALAYANNEFKDGIIDGFKRANEGMLKDLRAAMPKFGDEFSKKLFDKLNNLKDANGIDMNLNVHSLDELEDRMKKLVQSESGLSSIYMINDEIKSLAKGIKISNDQALKAQQANKDKKDK